MALTFGRKAQFAKPPAITVAAFAHIPALLAKHSSEQHTKPFHPIACDSEKTLQQRLQLLGVVQGRPRTSD